MSVYIIIYVLLAHWVSDFIFQTDWMATNKSKKILPLLAHTSVYSVSMGLILIDTFGEFDSQASLEFIAIMFVSHTMIDFVTSKATSFLWQKKRIRNFFDTVGLDQWLHYVTIFLTINYLYY